MGQLGASHAWHDFVGKHKVGGTLAKDRKRFLGVLRGFHGVSEFDEEPMSHRATNVVVVYQKNHLPGSIR